MNHMSLSSPAEYHYPHYDSTTPVGHKRLLTDSKEVNWAIGGAALGLTVAIVEYIANNVFEGRNGQVAERRRGDYYSSQQARSKKNKKFQDFLYDQKYPDYYYYDDYSHAFGVDDYNDQFRKAVNEHYAKDDYYDYEDYSYSQFFKKTFSPLSAESRVKVQKLPTTDVYKNKKSDVKSKPSSLSR